MCRVVVGSGRATAYNHNILVIVFAGPTADVFELSISAPHVVAGCVEIRSISQSNSFIIFQFKAIIASFDVKMYATAEH